MLSRFRNTLSQSWSRQCAVLAVLTAVAACLAYQVRAPMRIAIGDEDRKHFSGFYFVQTDSGHSYRWSSGHATVTFPDVGKTTPVSVNIVAYAWRDANQVYTATVTVNGQAAGVIDRAGWRNWRFLVSDPAILRSDELVVEFRANPFIPTELLPDSADNRELGVAVESVEIQPLWDVPASLGDWSGLVVIPSMPQMAFVVVFVPTLYLVSRSLGLGEKQAFCLGIAVILFSAIGIAFFRIVASQRVLILTLAVGIVSSAKTLLDVVFAEPGHQDAAAVARPGIPRVAVFIVPVSVFLVAFLLRLHSMAVFPVEGDDGLYMTVAEHYAQAIKSADWGEVIAFNGVIEHPRLYVLFFAAGLVIRDIVGIAWTNVVTMRLVAVMFGALQTALIALLNPLAGWFLAIQTTEIKFTSMAYLEALPALTVAVSIIAYERFRQTSKDVWMYVSALALGAAGASKFIYLAAGFAILPFLVWEQRRQPKKIAIYVLFAAVAFFALDPYLWYDPPSRLSEMLSFHSSFSQREYVKQLNRPWWYNLVVLAESAKLYGLSYQYPPPFLITWDASIYALGLLGLPALARRSRLYLAWLLFGALFISLWEAKWEQYAMVIATPLCLSAGYGIVDLCTWLSKRCKLNWRVL